MQSLARVWVLLLFLASVVLCVGFVPMRVWQLRVIENFSGYIIPVAALGIVSAVWWWRALPRLLSFLCLMSLLAGMSLQAPVLIRFFRQSAPTHSAAASAPAVGEGAIPRTPWGVALLNVDSENRQPERVVQFVRALDAEIVALLETTQAQVEELSGVFPHRWFVPQEGGVGLALVSKFPFTNKRSSLGEDIRPIIIADVQVPDRKSIPVVVFDALPPLGRAQVEESWLTTRRLGTMLRHEFSECIVLSDLNATPFTQTYRGFTHEAQLRDVQWGRGLRDAGMSRTWDTRYWWMRFTIDHAFFKGALTVRGMQVFDIPGSDHRGLLALFSAPGLVRVGGASSVQAVPEGS